MNRIKNYVIIGLCALLWACNESDNANDIVLRETVEFEYEKFTVPENIGETRIPVLLSAAASKDITLTIKIENRADLLENPESIAQEGIHFDIPVKELIIPTGESSGYFLMTVNDDVLVHDDRMFDIIIESVSDGAGQASISQVCRVVIQNDDFWPEAAFTKKQYFVPSTEEFFVIPLEIGGGVIRSPFEVKVIVENGTATEGVDFSLDKKSFTFTESNRIDSIVVRPLAEDLDADISFKMSFEVNDAGQTGMYPETEFVIQREIKYVSFAKRANWIYKGYTTIHIPVAFTGVRSSRDVSGKIRVKTVEGGLSMSDITLPSEYITSKGDTVINFTVEIPGGISTLPDAAFELEIEDVIDGEMGGVTTVWVRQQFGAEMDKELWSILGFSTEEDVNDGPAYAKNLIDGSMTTFWHTRWRNSGAGVTLPAWITVGFGNEIINVEYVKIYRRGGYAKTVEIWLSEDPDMLDFVYVGEMDFPSGSNGDVTFYLPYQFNAYAVKLNFPNSNTPPHVAIFEMDVSGRVVK